MANDYWTFRSRHRSIELDGLSYMRLTVAYTGAGSGMPVALLHVIPV